MSTHVSTGFLDDEDSDHSGRTRHYADDGTFLAVGTPHELAEQVLMLRNALFEVLEEDGVREDLPCVKVARSAIAATDGSDS
jgi:hypothetical protein